MSSTSTERSLLRSESQKTHAQKVQYKFKCSVCRKVLQNPVQCPNQHYFCRSCIELWMREMSKKCPECQCDLSSEKLEDLDSAVMEMLNNYHTYCENANRSFLEKFKLCFMEDIGDTPKPCRNDGCNEILERNEIDRHEIEECEFSGFICRECKVWVLFRLKRSHPCFIRQEMEELARRLEMNVEKQLSLTREEMKIVREDVQESDKELARRVEEQLTLTREAVRDVKITVQQQNTEITKNIHEAKEAAERSNLLTGKVKIIVCGGYDEGKPLDSVEALNVLKNSWKEQPDMKEKRDAAAAFVHGNQIFVGGGWNGESILSTIESSYVDGRLRWTTSDVEMPIPCEAHRIVHHDDKVIMTGGLTNVEDDEVSDKIYSIQLNPPYTRELLTLMPESRWFHGSLVIDDQVLIFGGRKSGEVAYGRNTVYSYSLSKKEWKVLPPLPYAVSAMGIVRYRSNAILIGGYNEKFERLNKVLMYDVKTGQSEMLPSLHHKRSGCAAVIAGNIIVVVGGHGGESYLDSVECLDLTTRVWRELSAMHNKRNMPSAVLTPLH